MSRIDDTLLAGPLRRRPRGRPRISLNLTAMIDVVFLLLVYFMVATEFKAGEEIFRLDLPDRQPSKQQRDPFELDEDPLRIRIASAGMTRNACRIRIEGPYEQPLTFDDLRAFLVDRRMDGGVATGLFERDHPVLIIPTPATRWEHAVEAFNAAVRAGYHNLTLARPE